MSKNQKSAKLAWVKWIKIKKLNLRIN